MRCPEKYVSDWKKCPRWKERVLVKVVRQRNKELQLTLSVNGLQKMIRSSAWLCGCVMTRLIEITFPHKCSICCLFQDKLWRDKNFNPAFIVGSKNLWTSSFKDHAASDMHQHSMVLYKKSQSSGEVSAYAPRHYQSLMLGQNKQLERSLKLCISLLRKTCFAWLYKYVQINFWNVRSIFKMIWHYVRKLLNPYQEHCITSTITVK